MGQLDNKHFQIAATAIDLLDAAKLESDIAPIVAKSVSAFGFEYFCCASPRDRQPTFDACVLMNRWPKDWFALYLDSDFQRHDPIASYTRSQFRSLQWSEVPIPDDPVARSIMTIAAEDYGLKRGVSVPIHGLSGYQAGISFAGTEIETSIAARSAVELIAIYAFNKLTHFRAAGVPTRVLTPRQREILSWAAMGKTAWDIGKILSISTDTVNKLMATAIVRLDATNRTHAVVEAIRRKEIQI
jgi:LuxR family quorum sensing-dependent transcriptional regulator